MPDPDAKRYGEYDPAAPQPTRVLGWYDLRFVDYPNLPDVERLVEVSDADWEDRFRLTCVQDGVLVEPPYVPPAPVRALPPLAYRRRFTPAERNAVAIASIQSLLATPPDATLRVWIDDAASARSINLDDPTVSAGLDLMIAKGLLAPARKPQLLADVTQEELEL